MTTKREANPGTLPLLSRHAGVWRGVYTHMAPDRTILDRHDFRILVELPGEPACAYRQSSSYWWEDGRKQSLVFEAQYDAEADQVHWDNGRIAGHIYSLDAETLYLTFRFAATQARVCEMIQLSPCGKHRARTWHWLDQQGELEKITLVEEAREKQP